MIENDFAKVIWHTPQTSTEFKFTLTQKMFRRTTLVLFYIPKILNSVQPPPPIQQSFQSSGPKLTISMYFELLNLNPRSELHNKGVFFNDMFYITKKEQKNMFFEVRK